MSGQILVLSIMLARVCVSEAGWTNHDECAVIVHALINQSEQREIPLRSQICAYAPNSCDRERDDERRWIAFLHPELRRPPPGWPEGTRWETHRAMFAAMVLTSYRAYIGEIVSPCPLAFHWASPHCRPCRERMRQYGFVRAGCGLSNSWWRRE
jgi:hypothetical protein